MGVPAAVFVWRGARAQVTHTVAAKGLDSGCQG